MHQTTSTSQAVRYGPYGTEGVLASASHCPRPLAFLYARPPSSPPARLLPAPDPSPSNRRAFAFRKPVDAYAPLAKPRVKNTRCCIHLHSPPVVPISVPVPAAPLDVAAKFPRLKLARTSFHSLDELCTVSLRLKLRLEPLPHCELRYTSIQRWNVLGRST
ncbi:hypothetical protein MKEN_00286200 [Mycena kentingensis (nom. inval.)]|nr:hypothetical protein MKEN_00286200 [Mycena kentingensis (nom. inval.)]